MSLLLIVSLVVIGGLLLLGGLVLLVVCSGINALSDDAPRPGANGTSHSERRFEQFTQNS